MMFTRLFVLACVVTVSFGQVPLLGACPEVTTKPDFVVDKYLGKWYEVARYYPMFFEFATKCGIAQYSLKPNGRILVNNTGIKYLTGGPNIAIGEAFVFAPEIAKGALQVSFGNFAPNAANYLVLDTDYETFSVVYSCDSLASLVRLDYLWILGWNSTIPEEKMAEIYNMLARFDISTKYVKMGEHDCGF